MNPTDLKYSREHEWVRPEGGEAVVGITDYAQEQLGDVVYVLLPPEGEQLEQGKKLGEVESVKSVSDIFSPVSGEVVAVNEALNDQPELINEDPYGKGWIARVRLSDPGQVDGLMSAQQYEEMLAQEG